MAEIERTRIRERERPTQNPYELALQQDKAFGERQMMGRIVVKLADCQQELSRQGRLRFYLDPTVDDTPLRNWVVFTHEVRTVSGKHRHQGGLVIYVIDGKGYSVVDGKRYDWKEFDTLAIPGGSWFEHHNASAKEPLFLFVASDEPTLKKLDLYQKWGKDAAGVVCRIP